MAQDTVNIYYTNCRVRLVFGKPVFAARNVLLYLRSTAIRWKYQLQGQHANIVQYFTNIYTHSNMRGARTHNKSAARQLSRAKMILFGFVKPCCVD